MDTDSFAKKVADGLAKLPKATGQTGLGLSGELGQVIAYSDTLAKTMQDSYVTEEHLFLSLLEKAQSLREIFETFSLTFALYKKEVESLRG